MGLTINKLIRNTLMSFIMALMLLPAVALASTEYKGTETVNINKANAATLAAYLKGVGANKAEAIVKYRKSNGKFSSIEDLKNVPGVGDETFKDVKKNVSTSRGKSVAPEGYKMAETSGKSTSTKKKTTTRKSSSSTKNEKGKTTSTAAKKKGETKSTAAKKSATEKKSTAKKSSSTKKTAAKKKSASEKKTATKRTKKKSTAKKSTSKKKATKKKSTKKKKSSS